MRVLSRLRIPPSPCEDLFDNPRRRALPSAGRNAVDELCLHFWATECRPFPLDFDTVFGIVRAHRPTFSRHHAEIMAIFAELRPRLEHAWRAKLSNHESLRELRARHTAAKRAKRMSVSKTSPLVPLTPKHGARRKERLAHGDQSFYASDHRKANPIPTDTDLFRDA
jgi:hypothetical protein